jgi:hypothetical protein
VSPTSTRQERLRTLRQQERATALLELKRAEADRARIEADLDRLRRRIDELVRRGGAPAPGTVTTAGALAAGSRRQELDRERVSQLEIERARLEEQLRTASATLGRARDDVAAATRALKALGL